MGRLVVRWEKNMICNHCHHQNLDDSLFCENCGKPLTTICPNCKEPNEADTAFCIKCGQSLRPAAQPVSSNKPARRTWLWVIMALLLIGVFTVAAMIGLRSLNQSDNLTVAATEGKITTAPTAAQVSTEVFATPTKVPSATPELTEATTAIASAPLPEIADSKAVVMVLVPAGEFLMGGDSVNAKPDEIPVHRVYLDAYYIDKFEVTNAVYRTCVDAGKCEKPIQPYFFPTSPNSNYYSNPQYEKYPVVYVDWNRAKAFCDWRGARLPTEAQWEKAARGTGEDIYPWGSSEPVCQKANFTNCVNSTSEVGSYEEGKSPYNAYDMAGNVWEWVADWYSEAYYQNSLSDNPSGPNSGLARVLRGGAWTKYDIRVSTRFRFAPTYSNFDIGFRCALVIP